VTPEPDWLTLGQAARFLGVAQSTIRKWSDQGRVPAFYTPGGHRRFQRADLEAFIEQSAPARRGGRPRVLVVEGDATLRRRLQAGLEGAGYAVLQADRLDEEGAPALVLLDVATQGVDGWELLQRLEERHGSIPVVMYSGEVDAFDPDVLVGRAKALVPA
jgi:excisionase family DNA binding protein